MIWGHCPRPQIKHNQVARGVASHFIPFLEYGLRLLVQSELGYDYICIFDATVQPVFWS